jgi:sodium/hydrogen antiporter
MVWSQLDPTKAHVAYAVVAVFSACFSLCSLFVKEKLYLGEASVATIYGLIVGQHCLNWFNPFSWGNYFYITLEISRVLLCIEIVAVAVELPKRYVLKHWFSLFLLLIPGMTAGWLIIGALIYAIIPGLHFSHGLLISACITATDPILAQAVVGKGKFAKRVPAHLRNLLSAESACNDGVSVPFVYLALNIILHGGNSKEIAKEWICVTVLYECVFGCVLGTAIGYLGRKSLKYAEEHDLIDRESFLAFYIMLALMCAGFGSILGIDDLLASFCAGTAFAWDGWFTHRTEESNVSTVIDILLNMAYFVYFGTIVPWSEFNDASLGLNCWRLICLALVVIFLRRIPAVFMMKAINPDIKNWKEALFVGHFGPIGVGAVFAAIIAISDLEAEVLHITHGPSTNYPTDSEHYQLIRIVWPTVCFLIVTSIIVHGSSVAVMTLGKQLQSMTFTMTWTKAESDVSNTNWFNRLPKIERSGTSFSLKRIDTMNKDDEEYNKEEEEYESGLNGSSGVSIDDKNSDGYNNAKLNARLNANIGMERFNSISNAPTFETSGTPAKPIGGANRKKKRKLLKRRKSKMRKEPPVPQTLDLKMSTRHNGNEDSDTNYLSNDDVQSLRVEPQEKESPANGQGENASVKSGGRSKVNANTPLQRVISNASQHSITSETSMRGTIHATPEVLRKLTTNYELSEEDLKPEYDNDGDMRVPSHAYSYGDNLVIEDQHGEVLRTVRSRTDTLASKHSVPSVRSSSPSVRSRANTAGKKIANTIIALPRTLLPGDQKKKDIDGEEHDENDSIATNDTNDDDDVAQHPKSLEEVLDYQVEPVKVKSQNKQTRKNTTASNKTTYSKIMNLSDKVLFKNDVPRKTKTLHGFRVNDDIIIENEDGEILGRYKVNVKKQKAEEMAKNIDDKQYNETMIKKALKYVGLQKRREHIDEEMNQLGNSELIPENNDMEDMGIENKIKHFINADPRKAIVSLPGHISTHPDGSGLRSFVNKNQTTDRYRNRSPTTFKKFASKDKVRMQAPTVLVHGSDSEYTTDDDSDGDDNDEELASEDDSYDSDPGDIADDDNDDDDDDDDEGNGDNYTLDSAGRVHKKKRGQGGKDGHKKKAVKTTSETEIERARRNAALSRSNRRSDDEEE